MFRWLGKNSRKPLRANQRLNVPRDLETLEDRVVPVISAPWEAVGPGPITDGQIENVFPNNEVIGAVQAVAPHPTDPNVLFIGGVNGGVWRTLDALSNQPTWVPLTDQQDSLSIADLKFNPGNPSNLIAAIGRRSSFAQEGTELSGLLITRDGGNTFTALPTGFINEDFTAAAIFGPNNSETILASASGLLGGTGGVFRSTNGGASFTRVLNGSFGDLIIDPLNPNRVWAAALGDSGIFFSANGGLTWTNVTEGVIDGEVGVDGDTDNIKLALFNDGVVNVLYVGVVTGGQFSGLFWTSNEGTLALHDIWTAMDVPLTNENGTLIGINPVNPRDDVPQGTKPVGGAQGIIHFSMSADPTNSNIVYVGGDRQDVMRGTPNSIGAVDFSGRLFRGNRSIAPVGGGVSPQWTPLTHVGTASNSSPHADSRDMGFNAIGELIEGDDGGVYRRTDPRSALGDWVSLNGNLQITEYHSVDYDALTNTAIGGAQDVGTSSQVSPFDSEFETIFIADGGVVNVDDSNPSFSIRYTSSQFFGFFSRNFFDINNQLIRSEEVPLLVGGLVPLRAIDPTIQFYQPYELNAINPSRMLIGTAIVYESTDRGDTLTPIFSPGTVTAMAYGGRRFGIDNPGVFYVGNAFGQIFFRESETDFAGFPTVPVARTTYPGNSVRDIAVDPDDWAHVFVIDENQVFESTDAGLTWTDVTGNLPIASDLQTIVYVPGAICDGIVVGGEDGVARALVGHTDNTWEEVGADILPNAEVRDLRYDAIDNVLIAGLLGRGAWKLQGASQYLTGGLGRVIALDLSQSMTHTQSIDIDGDGVLSAADDFDRDGVKGTPLDQSLYALDQALVQGQAAGPISILAFGRDAKFMDMSLAPGVQITANANADENGNGVADVIDIVRSLQVGGGGIFTSVFIDPSNTFYDSALGAIGSVPGINDSLVTIYSDGSAFLANNSPTLAGLAAQGVQVDVLLFGSYQQVGSTSTSATVATITGGVLKNIDGTVIVDNARFAINSSPTGLPNITTLLQMMGQADLLSAMQARLQNQISSDALNSVASIDSNSKSAFADLAIDADSIEALFEAIKENPEQVNLLAPNDSSGEGTDDIDEILSEGPLV